MKKTIEYFTYKLEEMNFDLIEQAIQNIASKGFGAAGFAVIPFTLFKYIAREYAELEGKSDIANYVKIKAYKYVDGEPTLCPEIMEIINTYFNMYRTRDTHYYYYAPKSTPAKQVQNWLEDEFIGTMENPVYY